MSRPKIANRSDEVLRGDGIRLYGLDAEMELKMQAKRDPEFERQLKDWIEAVTKESFSHPDDIAESLKSGIVLCRLINAIWPGAIKTINMKPIALMEMENIGYYLKACWKLGVPSAELFVVSDLYLRKSIPSVLQNIYSLARIAQNVSTFNGPKIGPSTTHKKPAAKKWDQINVGQARFVDDYEDEEPEPATTNCVKCGMPAAPEANHCKGCGAKIVRVVTDGELTKKLSEAEKYREKLEKELQELKNLYQKEQTEKSNLAKDLEKLKKEGSRTTTTTSSSSDREVRQLKDQIEQESAQKKKAMQELSDLQSQNGKLKSQLTDQENKTKRLEDELRKKGTATGGSNANEVAELKRQLDSVIRENTRLNSDLRDKDAKLREIQRSKPQPAAPGLTSGRTTIKPKQPLLGVTSLRNMDQGLLTDLQSALAKILFSEPIDFSEVTHLNEFFKQDAGRRLFTQKLKQTMKTVPTLVLSENNFELLLYLVNTVLQQMDLSDSKDLITAKILMLSSKMLSREVDGHKEYIKQFIRSHEIWRNLSFWEEQFWDELSQKFKSYEHGEASSVGPLVLHMIPDFACEMLDWHVAPTNAQSFIKDMCSRYNVDTNTVPLLKVSPDHLESYLRQNTKPGSRIQNQSSHGNLHVAKEEKKKGSKIKRGFWG